MPQHKTPGPQQWRLLNLLKQRDLNWMFRFFCFNENGKRVNVTWAHMGLVRSCVLNGWVEQITLAFGIFLRFRITEEGKAALRKSLEAGYAS